MEQVEEMSMTERSVTYDDVLIVPAYSDISSRHGEDIDTRTELTGKGPELSIPIVSANMDTVTGWQLAREIHKLGGAGILHRFRPASETYQDCRELRKNGCPNIVSIGLGTTAYDDLGVICDDLTAAVCIDTAHGHCKAMLEQIARVKREYPTLPIIAGNVATGAAALDLVRTGADAVKVGVGPGSLCTTRLVTGCGVPQITALADVHHGLIKAGLRDKVSIIADGGIRHSGDIVKALAIGADSVMIGALFAACVESCGRTAHQGSTADERGSSQGPADTKYYRGMASEGAQRDWKGYVSVVEGESTWVKVTGTAEELVTRLMSGVRSGMSYVGAHNIEELKERATFTLISPASLAENRAHLLERK